VNSNRVSGLRIQILKIGDRRPGANARNCCGRQAGQTRRNVFERFCDASTVMCVVHFPSPSTGARAALGSGYKLVA
jgi:hypothetical protein